MTLTNQVGLNRYNIGDALSERNRHKSSNITRPFLSDLFVRDHRSMVLKVWGARETLAVTGIFYSTLVFISLISVM